MTSNVLFYLSYFGVRVSVKTSLKARDTNSSYPLLLKVFNFFTMVAHAFKMIINLSEDTFDIGANA